MGRTKDREAYSGPLGGGGEGVVLRENQGRVRGKLTTLRSPVEAGFCDPLGALEDTLH